MKERLAALLLVPLLLVVFLSRQGAGPRLAQRAPDAPLESALVDPQSAWLARRVSLAISAGRLAQSDRFLSHPTATALLEPPLFPTLLAMAGSALLGERGEGAPPDERRLEGFLRGVGPLLALALALAAFTAARRGGSRAGGGCGLLTLAAIGLSPAAWRLGLPGVLALEHWAALLFALQAWLCRWAWSARESLDRMQGALLAGIVTGLGLSSTPLFVIPTLAAWVGGLFASYSAPAEERRDHARAGLLFSIAALCLANLPVLEGPWQAAPEGPVLESAQLASGFLLLGVLAFAPCFVGRLGASCRPSNALALGAALGLGLVLLVLLEHGGSGPARPLAASLGLVRLPSGERVATSRGDWLLDLWPWLALGALAVLARRDRAWSGERVYLVLGAALATLAAALHRPAAVLALLPLALLADEWMCAGVVQRVRGARAAGSALLALAFASCVLALAREFRMRRSQAVPHAGIELVRALRWLRENSEPSGSWNSTGAVQSYALLTDGALAELAPYHARRPVLGTSVRAAGDARGQRAAWEILGAADPAELVRAAHEAGARYLVVRAAPSGWDGGRGPGWRALASGAMVEGLRLLHSVESEGPEGPAPVRILRIEPAQGWSR